MRSSKKRSLQKAPVGKRGPSKKSPIFNMPKAKVNKVGTLKKGKIPTKRKATPKGAKGYKGISVSKMYGD